MNDCNDWLIRLSFIFFILFFFLLLLFFVYITFLWSKLDFWSVLIGFELFFIVILLYCYTFYAYSLIFKMPDFSNFCRLTKNTWRTRRQFNNDCSIVVKLLFPFIHFYRSLYQLVHSICCQTLCLCVCVSVLCRIVAITIIF